MPSCIAIRYNGSMYKVAKSPFESREHAWDRAWWLVKHTPDTMPWHERMCMSHMWASEKHWGMKFLENKNTEN